MAIIDTDHYDVFVVVETCIEIPQKDCTKSILVKLIIDRLDCNKAFIFTIAEQVSLRFDGDNGFA